MHCSALLRSFELEYEPSLHGSAAAAPAAQNEPASHDLHSSLPGSAWYVPAAQLTHAPMLVAGATVPGLHGVCLVLPVDA